MSKKKFYKITDVAKMLETTVPKIKKVLRDNDFIEMHSRPYKNNPYSIKPMKKFEIPSKKAIEAGLVHKKAGCGDGVRGPYLWNVEMVRSLVAGDNLPVKDESFDDIKILEKKLRKEGVQYGLGFWFNPRYRSWNVYMDEDLVGKMIGGTVESDKSWRLYSNFTAQYEDYDRIVQGDIPEVVRTMYGVICK